MAIDWTHAYRRFKGLWVAFKDDEKTVIASGRTAKEALKKAKIKGYEMPILAHMPKILGPYIGSL